jgi:transposase
MGVAIGIDSHKRSLGAGVTDELGREVAAKEFPNDPQGHKRLLGWARAQGADRVIGIEGSGSYGAGIARFLLAAGEDVKEVPAFVAHRERKKSPSKGKSDLGDALAIARVTARGDGLFSPHRSDVLHDLKLLSDHRDQLVRARTRIINRTHTDLVVSHPGYERRIPQLKAKKHLDAAMALVRGDRSVRAELIRHNVSELRRLNRQIADVERDIISKVKEADISLTQLKGISFITAAKVLGEVGAIGRIRSKEGFAMLNGTAPLEVGFETASSAQPWRQPPAQLCLAHDGDRTLQQRPRHQGLHRTPADGGKIQEGSHPVPQAPPLKPRLPSDGGGPEAVRHRRLTDIEGLARGLNRCRECPAGGTNQKGTPSVWIVRLRCEECG